ncbi:uncharacterized protein LOC116105567 isoform X8 [Pistacia vera]|uniref:uncharacterized protein LOC116105567 isoform X8 n=1 Tax=Pistacia vera TaxID=55513 RepID=UPI0012634B57|nr:uncharacterized protein LOC116105567 isoform X8 [Pistacia vera]
MLDCIVRIVQEEGLLSLWGGNGSSVLRYYPSVALSFSLKLGQGKAIEDPHADCYKDGEDQSDMVKIHEDQKFEVFYGRCPRGEGPLRVAFYDLCYVARRRFANMVLYLVCRFIHNC